MPKTREKFVRVVNKDKKTKSTNTRVDPIYKLEANLLAK